ncbi:MULTISPECIES: septation protein SepH [unclassified Microbacterium]|uniref:septation protein SepH n=1 Tax=unclassified Microbacterium TaxID=2609290 RepID=UPI00301A1D09
MEQLKVIGIEEGVLVVATDAGERFALPADETLRAQLRRLQRAEEPRAVRPSPRDIQAHIRAGMSAQEVADLLGARLEDIERYEGPVVAEREHIVSQALAVPVLIGGELDASAQPTFGTAVRAKLAEAGAAGERWTSWKDESGWVIKLEFTANEVDHDARWSFDPRRSTLAPQNADATQLSRQGSLPEGLIPRLRALDHSPLKDSSRFDSGAFGPRRLDPDAEIVSRDARPAATAAVQDAAIKRAPEQGITSADTADLLEALRRRRGLREPMPEDAADAAEAGATASPAALFDALEPGYDDAASDADEGAEPEETVLSEASRRKGRTSMPSWDEIVFGARTEDG